MIWGEILQKWLKNDYPKYPSHVNCRFFYETSPYENYWSRYEEKLIVNFQLKAMIQNENSFKQHIKDSKDDHVTSFLNISKSAMLVIPMPRKGKIFTTLKDFMDNASEKQQQKFWNLVAVKAMEMNDRHGKVWISTHGLGVPYLHVRIDISPKYYVTRKFK